MKITRLHLVNFRHIFSGMGKKEITLDLTKFSKKINIFIGRMGSGKTAILGHLQPFSSYGSLDERNQIDPILDGEDGLKEIDYVCNGTVYQIVHRYTWNKSTNSHNTKSYIKRNGEELNSNGNNRSFKEIVHREFGIDQNFLRLLRLGPNVSNLINMKSTDRKTFIASLLQETEIYAMLYQKFNEEYRSINGALNATSSRLLNISATSKDSIISEIDELSDDIRGLQIIIDDKKAKIAEIGGENKAILQNRTPSEIAVEIEQLKHQNQVLEQEIKMIQTSIDNLPKIDATELSNRCGKLNEEVIRLNTLSVELKQRYDDLIANKNKLIDAIAMSASSDQIDALERSAELIEEEYQQSMRSLSSYSVPYSYKYLIDLVEIVNSIQFAINDIVAYPVEIIRKLYFSDSTALAWAARTKEISQARRNKLKKQLENAVYSAQYSAPIPLFFPPGCKTKTCPFAISHPAMIRINNPDLRSEKFVKLQNEIESLDAKIAECDDMVSIQPRLENLKSRWGSIVNTLSSIQAISCDSLIKILTDFTARSQWCDVDKIMDVAELAKRNERFDELKERRLQVQKQLMDLKNDDMRTMRATLENTEKDISDTLSRMEEIRDDLTKTTTEKDATELSLATLNDLTKLQQGIENNTGLVSQNVDKIDELQGTLLRISENASIQDQYMGVLRSLTSEYETKSSKLGKLRSALQEIESTTELYQSYLEERNIIKLILDATSSKDGIPVVMIKMFLDECKDIVNDLISDIFDDDLEILDFTLREDSPDFKIPFSINGVRVEDISQASQGQTSVISIALSFALCRKSMFEYNIMLLDEIDNSIHRADREKFIAILAKQMQSVNAEQIFLITHNDIFQQSGLPVNLIMTTPENVDTYSNQTTVTLY